MKKNILSSFSRKQAYGVRNHFVSLYEVSGNFFVEYKFTSMSQKEVRPFDDRQLALLYYIQKVNFLLS